MKNKLSEFLLVLLLVVCLFCIHMASKDPVIQRVQAQLQTTSHAVLNQRMEDDQSFTLLAVSQDTNPTPSTGSTRADVEIKYGTVVGSYTTCTAQLKTTYNGTDFLTIGTASSVTVTSNTVNTFTVMGQAPVTTGVTNGTVSASAALTIGRQVKITTACSGSYGTTAPYSFSITLS